MSRRNPLSTLLKITLCFALTGSVVQAADEADQARAILEASGVQGGVVVHLGCGDGQLTAALRVNPSYTVHGLDRDPACVAAARQSIQSLGEYGLTSVDRLEGRTLPYIDDLVNLVVVSENGCDISDEEIHRVLCPGGVSVTVDSSGAVLQTWTKPRPEAMDEWTHYLHDPSNNAVAHDSLVAPPNALQWVGGPRYSRHHDHMSSVSAVVSAGGRLFTIFDQGRDESIQLPSDWALIARDAFNGTILWKRPIEKWHVRLWPLKSGPAELPRRLVAVGDTVYVTLGLDAPLSVLNAATGETIRTYQDTASTEEILYSEGTLFLVVQKQPGKRDTVRSTVESLAEVKRLHTETAFGEQPRTVMAVDAASGKVLWETSTVIMPLTLAADANRNYFHDGTRLVCLDRATGKQLWATEPIARKSKFISEYAPVLVVAGDVVLFAGGAALSPRGSRADSMIAVDAATGKELWVAEHPPSGYRSPEDILVAGGLVWTAATSSGRLSGIFTGRDLRTGEVKSEFAPDVDTYWFHHRCYRGKATDDYLLMSRTGIEFVDYRKEHWNIHHWVRGACLYGVMPCNGMVYAPQHPCACYPEAKLYGFNALKAAPASTQQRRSVVKEAVTRLERGPAYEAAFETAAATESTGSWSTYRGNAARSGSTDAAVSPELNEAWGTELKGKLSAPTIAGGKVYVSSIESHAVLALDATSGRQLWSFTAGGRVDSPPTYWQGRLLFGSADGCVYCLRADDGALVWKYRGMPMDERLMAFEQLESVWPVHGSVLVQDGVACFAVGRSVFLDGGLRLVRLDAATGRRLSETMMDDRDPETGESLQDRIQTLQMPVGLTDILSCDGSRIYMKSQSFDLQGKRLELGPHSGDPAGQGSVQGGDTAHLFSPTGFLDDTWWHRTYWVYGRSFAGGHAGYYQAGRFAPAGRILVADDSTVYGFARKPEYYKWTTPLEYHLFAAPKQKEPTSRVDASATPSKGGNSMISVPNSLSLDPTGKPLTVAAWVKADGKNGVVVARGGPSQGYALLLDRGRPRFVIRAGEKVSVVEGAKPLSSDWTHLTGVLTSDRQLALYIDGRLAGEAAAQALIESEPKQPMEIGADDGGPVGEYRSPSCFAGLIDEVWIYHTALGAADIQALAATGSEAPDVDARPVAYFSFDKATAADDSGMKNNGLLGAVQAVDGPHGKAMKFSGVGTMTSGGTVQSTVQRIWTQEIPLLARGMTLAKGILFVAGPPDLVNEEETSARFGDPEVQRQLARQDAALRGELGADLWAVSAEDGSRLSAQKLQSMPIFDGLAAANGCLYMSTVDGRVICLGPSEN